MTGTQPELRWIDAAPAVVVAASALGNEGNGDGALRWIDAAPAVVVASSLLASGASGGDQSLILVDPGPVTVGSQPA